MQAYGVEGVEQGLAVAAVHGHVGTGDHGDVVATGQCVILPIILFLLGRAVQGHPQSQPIAKMSLQCHRLGIAVGFIRCRQPHGEALPVEALNILQAQRIATFVTVQAAATDDGAQFAVGTAAGGEQNQSGAVVEYKSRGAEEFDRVMLAGLPGFDNARQRAFVGQSNGLVTQGGGLFHQLLGMGGRLQKTVVALAIQGGKHGITQKNRADTSAG